MGGHGGLNILPQKRWNVYNFDNRERVRRDEEAAAKEEHIRRREEREKEAESRLAKLRQVAHAKTNRAPSPTNPNASSDNHQTEEIQHLNLFEGLVCFQKVSSREASVSKEFKGSLEVDKKIFRGDKELERLYKRAAKEATKVGKDGVEADDERYRLGYGCSSKDKKQPWYLSKSSWADEFTDDGEGSVAVQHADVEGHRPEKRKKSIDELREERLKREQQERERAQRLLTSKNSCPPSKSGSNFGQRRPYYNSSFGNAR